MNDRFDGIVLSDEEAVLCLVGISRTLIENERYTVKSRVGLGSDTVEAMTKLKEKLNDKVKAVYGELPGERRAS